MKKDKIWRRLNDALHTGMFITVLRGEIDESRLQGFVVGLSQRWALINIVDADFVQFNGYRAVRVRDITRIYTTFSITERFLALNKKTPVPQPDILLLDLPGLLSSANAVFPLVRVEEEYTATHTGYIGRVVKVGEKTLTLRLLNVEATWSEEPRRFYLKDITLVGFGDAYDAALWRIAQEETPSPSP